MERLIRILQRLRPDIDFCSADGLFFKGGLDSLDVVALITDINLEFGISIPPHRINEDTLDSLESLWSLILECSKGET